MCEHNKDFLSKDIRINNLVKIEETHLDLFIWTLSSG